jgi:GTPase SAR1 family protein
MHTNINERFQRILSKDSFDFLGAIDAKSMIPYATRPRLNAQDSFEVPKMYMSDPEINALEFLIGGALGPHEARKSNNDLYAKMYVYHGDKGPAARWVKVNFRAKTNLIHIPVNITSDETKRFVFQYLVNTAKYVKGLTDRLRAVEVSKIAVVGPTGSGKTAFLNNIFSRYHAELDAENVIWVRVDLMKMDYAIRPLNTAKKAQLAYIIKANYPSTLADFRAYAYNIEDKTVVDAYCDDCSRSHESTLEIQRENSKTILDVKRFDDLMYKFAREKHCLIFILDGFDRVRSHDTIFQDHLNQLGGIFSDEHIAIDLHIVVMRHRSHAEMVKNVENNHASANFKGEFKLFEVLTVPLRDVVDSRFKIMDIIADNELDAAKEIIASESLTFSQDDIGIIKHKFKGYITNDVVRSVFKVFLRYVHRGLSFNPKQIYADNWSEDDFYDVISGFTGHNTRKGLSLLKDAFTVFISLLKKMNITFMDIVNISNLLENRALEMNAAALHTFNKILAQHYHITRALLGGSDTYMHPHFYQLLNNRLEPYYPPVSLPTPLLRSVYKGIQNDDELTYQQYNLLCKIRILQLLNKEKTISHKDICSKLISCFDYDKHMLEMEILELQNMMLITPSVLGDNATKMPDISYRSSRQNVLGLSGAFAPVSNLALPPGHCRV